MFLNFFLQENGSRFYECGVTISAAQQEELDSFKKEAKFDAKFIGTLVQIIFGTSIFAVSSISGKAKTKTTTEKLDEAKLEFACRKLEHVFLR
jgi:hypothetical protein